MEERSKELEEFLRQNFPEYVGREQLGQCPFCGEPVVLGDFRDTLSLKEFCISGLCQRCQDEFFKS